MLQIKPFYQAINQYMHTHVLTQKFSIALGKLQKLKKFTAGLPIEVEAKQHPSSHGDQKKFASPSKKDKFMQPMRLEGELARRASLASIHSKPHAPLLLITNARTTPD
jgi:hypothetical protein